MKIKCANPACGSEIKIAPANNAEKDFLLALSGWTKPCSSTDDKWYCCMDCEIAGSERTKALMDEAIKNLAAGLQAAKGGYGKANFTASDKTIVLICTSGKEQAEHAIGILAKEIQTGRVVVYSELSEVLIQDFSELHTNVDNRISSHILTPLTGYSPFKPDNRASRRGKKK